MKMTLEQHREFGETVKRFREALLQTHIINVATKASRESRAVQSLFKSLDRLKHRLDSMVFNDFPGCKDAKDIYYGPSRNWIEQQNSGCADDDRRRLDWMEQNGLPNVFWADEWIRRKAPDRESCFRIKLREAIDLKLRDQGKV